MITLRRAQQRHRERRRAHEAWLTFNPLDRADPLADGFGPLEFLSEDRLPPGKGLDRSPPREAEVLTYAREGAIAYEDSIGRSTILHAGEFQRLTSTPGLRHGETNASRSDSAHVFQLWLRPSEAGLLPGLEQKRFSAADRRRGLCVVASPDGRKGSLVVHQDAVVYSTLLDRGQHLVYALTPGRWAWLHVVTGKITLDELALAPGDSLGLSAERAVSLTASEEAELLLVDLGGLPAEFKGNGVAH
jgi:redox-sensitive bicupin YhaK (pirin superfamily)